MPVVHLLRHGQASFGDADYDVLSPLGTRQGRLAGAELARRGVRDPLLRTGTLRRQQDTAAALRTELATAEPVVDPRWDEYDHLEVLAHHGDGSAPDAAEPAGYDTSLGAALAEWVRAGAASPCARTWPDFRDGAHAALTELLAELGAGGRAVVVTSGGIIGTLAGLLIGVPEVGLRTMSRVTVNAGISLVITGRGGTNLLSFNEQSHLDEPGVRTYR